MQHAIRPQVVKGVTARSTRPQVVEGATACAIQPQVVGMTARAI